MTDAQAFALGAAVGAALGMTVTLLAVEDIIPIGAPNIMVADEITALGSVNAVIKTDNGQFVIVPIRMMKEVIQ